jgi:Ca2+-binding RTX toxin-like protein
MGRRTVVLVAAMLVALGGVALAETLTGNDRDNRLIGSNGRDSISGGGGDDFIIGLRSRESLNGGAGNDFVYAYNRPAAKDVVNCGRGRDRGVFDRLDVVTSC